MTFTIEELKVKANAYYENKILIYVKRKNGYGQLENINGYIVKKPEKDFFYMSDIIDQGEPKIVFFIELIIPEAIFAPSSKGGRR